MHEELSSHQLHGRKPANDKRVSEKAVVGSTRRTCLRFPHDLDRWTDPAHQNKLLTCTFLVVCISDTDVCEAGFGVVKMIDKFLETTSAGFREVELIRAV
jgi:hypothetical protein